MKYRRYGKNGPEISPLGFGVMRLPPRSKKDRWGRVNFTRGAPLLRAALEAGVNFLDTHHFYHDGDSETIIGRVLRRWNGPPVYIQTKTPFYYDKPIDYFKKLLTDALEKLGVDCIDYLLFHSMNHKMFRQRGRQFLRFSDWALNRGYIRFRGFSSHDTVANIRRFIDTGEFSVMLVSFNWLNPYVRDAIDYAAEHGMGVSIMNPVGGGGLGSDIDEIRHMLPGARTAAEVALRYVMSTPGVTTTLSGMSNLEQIEENVAIAGRRSTLTQKQRNVMLDRIERIRRRGNWTCSFCGYCLPCPHNVSIPQNLLLYYQARFFGLTDQAETGFKAQQKAGTSALACRQCGKCLEKCPNNVAIIEQLAEAADMLGRP